MARRTPPSRSKLTPGEQYFLAEATRLRIAGHTIARSCLNCRLLDKDPDPWCTYSQICPEGAYCDHFELGQSPYRQSETNPFEIFYL